jgi:nucleoside-diphosphate-sugar epimerase
MKILLTGASGFIGTHILKQLQAVNLSVVVVGRTCPEGYEGEFIKGDLLEAGFCSELISRAEASHLIHMAWHAEHGNYWKSSLNLRWVQASIELSQEFCSAGGEHIVMAGTCAEYDWNYGCCIEDITPLEPSTLYGTSKDATRRIVMAICSEYRVPFAWVRPFIIYGPGEDRRRLIPSLMDVFDGVRVPFSVNANNYRDFLHVEDAASAFLAILKNKSKGVFNICSGQPTQIKEIVKLVAISRGADPRLVLSLKSELKDEPIILFGNNRKILETGWRPKHNYNELLGFSKMID